MSEGQSLPLKNVFRLTSIVSLQPFKMSNGRKSKSWHCLKVSMSVHGRDFYSKRTLTGNTVTWIPQRRDLSLIVDQITWIYFDIQPDPAVITFYTSLWILSYLTRAALTNVFCHFVTNYHSKLRFYLFIFSFFLIEFLLISVFLLFFIYILYIWKCPKTFIPCFLWISCI